ncbi:MAG: succinate--CoA ligase subunit beta [Deltaproteobacteria bacterium CG2_30_66_27]|nr:MAG: succinate--CoA ligase subunit beta [Deltaproteobacteria bacterium CG2_30_66_27]PJB31934.1 MAG: ADP-forming succinate--CoA ligase subunit beta [Deltaproteobacteria bacterium CG_4_9_14_3_um_filter_65_9]
MNIHEYQAKGILSKYGVAVPNGKVADTPAEAEAIAEEFGTPVVVKAQIHAGGRGKGGGVKLAKTPAEAREHAKKILGMTLVTHQTGPQGKKVKRVLVEQAGRIQRELYLGMVIDRGLSRVVMMASTEGGMEIETVAAKTPGKILKEWVDPAVGLMPFQARKLAFGLGIPAALTGKAVKLMTGLYKAFVATDCSLAEINPLVLTEEGDIVALDAKMNFDGNGLFRHKDIDALRDLDEEDPTETEAARFGLSYISLDGNIGCMVNGAGLAMATMDMIKICGGSPANFLDVGGGATAEAVTNAFRLILSDSKVKAILVNIFGGIMKCDVIAEGVVTAAKTLGLTVPLVVRLEGTNVKRGKEILAASKLNIIPAADMGDAAKKVVLAAAGQAN